MAEPLAISAGFVVTPDRRLVIGCQADAGDSTPWILCVPEEAPGGVQVLGEPTRIDVRVDGAVDRWIARHGPLRELQLFALRIESVRCGGRVWDAEEVRLENPIAKGEAALLRKLNTDAAALTRMCERASGVRLERATAVGVDAWGLWIRGATTPIRIEFGGHAGDVAAAERAVAAFLQGEIP
ncbi:MAG: hypothetical protein AABZ53_09135 [Planctomycetota bacterium]